MPRMPCGLWWAELPLSSLRSRGKGACVLHTDANLAVAVVWDGDAGMLCGVHEGKWTVRFHMAQPLC